MANEVIINIPGIGDVVAENAATEATLRDILAAIKSNGGIRGGGAGGGNNSNNNRESTEQREARSKMRVFGDSIWSGSKAIANLTMSTGGLIKRFADLDGSVTSAAYEVRDLSRQIPIIGEHLRGLGNAIVAVASAQDELVSSFQKASTVGASFAGSITQMAAQASAAGMTIREYSQFVASNGEAMRALGGTTEAGTKRFAILSKALQDSSSGLYALGMTTTDINTGLASYAKLMQMSNNTRKKSDADLITGTKAYLKELDLVAKATGESRAQAAERMASMNIDPQFSAFMDSLGAAGDDIRTSLLTGLGTIGPAASSILKDFISSGGIPTTEEHAGIAFALGGTAQKAARYKELASGGGMTKEESDAMLQDILNTFKKETSTATAQGNVANLTAMGDVGLNLLQKVSQEARKYEEDAQKRAKEEQDPIFQLNKTMQEVFSKFGVQITNISNKFKYMLASNGVFELLIRAFNGVSKFIDKITVPQFDNFGKVVSAITKKFTELGGPIFDKLMDTVDYLPDTLLAIYKTVFGDGSGIQTALTGYLQPMFDAIDGFNQDLSKLSPEQIRDAFAIWATGKLENSINWVQQAWVDIQLSVLEHIKTSWITTILSIGDNIGIAFTYIRDYMIENLGGTSFDIIWDNLKIKIVSIGETWDRLQIAVLNFIDMINRVNSMNPLSKYTEDDYNRDHASLNIEALTQEAELAAQKKKQAEEELAEKKAANKDKNDEDLKKNREERDTYKDIIENRKKTEEAYNTKIKEYTDELIKQKQELIDDIKTKNETLEERVRSNLGGPLTNDYNNEYAKLTSQPTSDEMTAYMIGMAETGGKSVRNANGGKAAGVHQWMPSTWANLTKGLYGHELSPDARYDPKLSSEVMQYALKRYQKVLEPVLHHTATPTDLYMTHFLGEGGGPKFMKKFMENPNQLATPEVVGEAAYKSNIDVFSPKDKSGHRHTRTLEGVYNEMGRRLKPINEDPLNAITKERQQKAETERKKQEEETARKQQEKADNDKQNTETTENDPFVKSSYNPNDHTELLERVANALDRLNSTSENMLSTHERHLNVASGQSNNLYA